MPDQPLEWADLPLVLTTDEVAEVLKVNVNTVKAMCRSGDLRATKLSAGWRINRADLMTLLRVRETAATTGEKLRPTLAALMAHIPEGIAVADAPDATIRMVSRYGQEHMSAAAQVSEGIPMPEQTQVWDLYQPDGVTPARSEDLPLARATMFGEVVTDEEWVLGRPSGERIPVLCNAGPVRDAQGRVIGGVIAWRDISALRKAERDRDGLRAEVDAQALALQDAHDLSRRQAVRLDAQDVQLRDQATELAEAGEHLRGAIRREGEATDLYRAVLDNATAGIAVYDGQDLRVKFANALYQQIQDKPFRNRNLVGLRLADFLPRAEESGLVHICRRVVATRQPYFNPEYEFHGYTRGATFWRFSLLPLPVGEGVPDLMVVQVEVTEQVRARRAAEAARSEAQALADQLAAERRFLATIMNTIPVAITYLDDTLTYRQCNEAAAREIGLPVDQVLGRHLREIVPGNSQVWEAVAKVLRTGEAYALPIISALWENRPDQGPRHYMVAYLPDKDEMGRVRGVVAEGQDVTELIEAQRALEQQSESLEQRVRERTAELAAVNDALRASREQLRSLAHRLIEAQEMERRAVARELHDETAQVLTALTIEMGALAKDADCGPAVAARLLQQKDALSGLMRELHELIVTLRPASLDRGDLVPAITQYVDALRHRHGLKAELVANGFEGQRLPPDIETTVYRLIQEALTNVVRHAQASQVGIVLEQRDGAVVAIIEDDGVGFDFEKALQRGRLGLAGMRERVEMLGGHLAIESAPGGGATVFVEIPLLEGG